MLVENISMLNRRNTQMKITLVEMDEYLKWQ